MAGGAIANLGASLQTRQLLFYLVCVPFRLSLAYILYKYSSNSKVRIISFLLSLVSAVHLFIKHNDSTDPVWWNRKYHAISSTVISVLIAFNRLDLASVTMVADVAFGLSSSRKGLQK